MHPAGDSYEFGLFRLDTRRHLLLRRGAVIPLTPRTYDLLLTLVTRSGSLVTKSELMAEVWGDVVVEENNLNQAISAVRKALGDRQNGTRYIETVPRLGYRFVADVRVNDAAETPPADSSSRRTAPKTIVAVAIPLTVGMAAVVILTLRGGMPQTSGGPTPSLAVLPFLAGGDDEYLGLGMADAVITRLDTLKDIAVRPTSAVDDLADPGRDAIDAGRQLRVDAVLDGRIQRSDGRLRVTAHLIDVRSRATLWSSSFDEPAKEIFTLQDAIADRLVDALVPTLRERTTERVARGGARSIAAYEHYIRARFLWNKRSQDGLQRALHAFQQALEDDPTFAEAYVGLADCYNLLPEYGSAPAHEAMPRAKAAALQALQIHPALGEAHASLAYTLANYEFDFVAAERAFHRAIDLAPGYATAHQWYGELLLAMRRPADALAAYQRARALDPLSPIISALVEYTHSEMGEHERAAEGLRRIVALHPGFGMAREYLSGVYERQLRFAEALDEIEQAHRLRGRNREDVVRLRRAYADGGISGFWRHRLAMELQQAHPSPFIVASYYVRLGDRERALEWLDTAYEQRDRFLIFVGAHRDFAPLASDRRFQALLRRMGL